MNARYIIHHFRCNNFILQIYQELSYGGWKNVQGKFGYQYCFVFNKCHGVIYVPFVTYVTTFHVKHVFIRFGLVSLYFCSRLMMWHMQQWLFMIFCLQSWQQGLCQVFWCGEAYFCMTYETYVFLSVHGRKHKWWD